MKRIAIGILIIIVGLISINFYKRFTEDTDFKVKFHVYSQDIRTPIEILFRRIPILYDTMIDVNIIRPYSKDLNLYKVNNDIFGGTPDLHYIVFDKDNREISDMKSRFLLSNIKDPENVDFNTIDSYSVDISTFLQIFEPHLKSSPEIADTYAKLLANSLDSSNFKRINQISDIEQIMDSHRLTESPMIDEDKTILNYEFLSHLAENEYLYWYYDKGLIKIQLDFRNNHLSNVETLRIGNLGVEIIHF